jgi:amino acid transporter
MVCQCTLGLLLLTEGEIANCDISISFIVVATRIVGVFGFVFIVIFIFLIIVFRVIKLENRWRLLLTTSVGDPPRRSGEYRAAALRLESRTWGARL